MTNHRFLFLLYLGLLIWAPLPLGSNRVWALSILEVGIFIVAFCWLILYFFNKTAINSTFHAARIPLILFALFSVYVLLQSIPLPMVVVSWIAPDIAQSYNQLAILNGDVVKTAYLSLNPYITTGKFVETFSYFLLFCLTLLLVHSRKRLKLLALVIVISGVFQAVYGTLMTLTGVEYSFFFEKVYGKGLATGTFVNRNHLAGYLEITLSLGIGLMIASLHRDPSGSWREFFRRMMDAMLGSKVRLRIALVLMVIALVMTHSRMGNTAFFASMTFTGLIYLILVKNPPKSAVALFISMIIIDVFIVGTWFGLDKVIERLEKTQLSIHRTAQDKTAGTGIDSVNNAEGLSTGNGSQSPNSLNTVPEDNRKLQVLSTTIESATESRDEAYRDTLLMINQHFVSGTGGGTYRYSFMRYQSADIKGYYDHVHNDYLEFMAEYGVIGFSLLGMLVVYSLVNALIALRKRHSRTLQGMAFASSMAIISLLIHSGFDFNLQIPANAALFVVILAMANMVRFKRIKGVGLKLFFFFLKKKKMTTPPVLI
jgi:O-antigen ligase